jgi:hypothetical protein
MPVRWRHDAENRLLMVDVVGEWPDRGELQQLLDEVWAAGLIRPDLPVLWDLRALDASKGPTYLRMMLELTALTRTAGPRCRAIVASPPAALHLTRESADLSQDAGSIPVFSDEAAALAWLREHSKASWPS